MKYRNIFASQYNKKAVQHFCLNILQKYYQLPILSTLDISGHFHQNGSGQTCQTSLTYFLRYYKDIANFFTLSILRMLGHAHKSPCMKL